MVPVSFYMQNWGEEGPKARRSWNRQFRNIGKVLVRALKEELFRKSEGDRDWSTIVYKRKSM